MSPHQYREEEPMPNAPGRHRGIPDVQLRRTGTDTGKSWDTLSDSERVAEFERSCAEPIGYALRNFFEESEREKLIGYSPGGKRRKPKGYVYADRRV